MSDNQDTIHHGDQDGMLTVVNPLPPRHAPSGATAVLRPLSLAGATVGFIDNSKPNFSLLADDLERLLRERFGVAKVLRHRKANASIGADPSVLDRMASESLVVISGSGD